jgi:hypothetical protein
MPLVRMIASIVPRERPFDPDEPDEDH